MLGFAETQEFIHKSSKFQESEFHLLQTEEISDMIKTKPPTDHDAPEIDS